jgi:hypothetical protein
LNERDFKIEKLMNKKRYLIIVVVVVVAVLLSILLYTMLANHRPVITSLVAESDSVVPQGSCQIACNAIDSDGDELIYEWSASGGEITGEEATVTWTAPTSAGFYNVEVVVTDGHGGSATGELDIYVSSTESAVAANTELEHVKTASLWYFGEHGVWPTTSADLSPTYISGTLKAVYTFDTSYGWVLGATPNPVDGWSGITFQAGTPGPTGNHGTWVNL